MTSPDIARIVETAGRAAAAAQHAFVGTEHLLAATLTEVDGGAARALAAAGVPLDGLAEELLAGLPRAEAGAPSPPPLSRFAERAVADASAASGGLVAVLLRSPRGRIASVLTRRGARLAELRGQFDPAPQAPQQEARAAAVPAAPSKKATPPKSGASPKATSPGSAHPRPEKAARRPARASERPVALEEEAARSERRLPPHLDADRRRSPRPELSWSLLLLLAVPISAVLAWRHAPALSVFIAACVGMIPLAGLMGQATEQLAERTGPMVGGLLNATFGNAAELIIAVVALKAGLLELVKASITGSILGNLLLILGLSLFAGGLKAPLLKFSRTSAGMSSAMLALAVAGLTFPALFHLLHSDASAARLALTEIPLSEAVAVILALTYGASLVFSLHTHRNLFGTGDAAPHTPGWRSGPALLVLGVATAGVVLESELLVGAIEPVTAALGLSQTFLGLMVIPLVGNAAEHATAVTVARKGKIDLALQISLGSSTQVALLIAPLLVLAGSLLGRPVSLLFTPLEVVALAISTGVVALITLDGESHWFEGVQLLALYLMVGAAAYFL